MTDSVKANDPARRHCLRASAWAGYTEVILPRRHRSTAMPKTLLPLAATLVSVCLGGDATAAAPEPTANAVRSAVVTALPLIQSSATEYTKHRQCFSCHHQAVPILAMTTARPRGFPVSAE